MFVGEGHAAAGSDRADQRYGDQPAAFPARRLVLVIVLLGRLSVWLLAKRGILGGTLWSVRKLAGLWCQLGRQLGRHLRMAELGWVTGLRLVTELRLAKSGRRLRRLEGRWRIRLPLRHTTRLGHRLLPRVRHGLRHTIVAEIIAGRVGLTRLGDVGRLRCGLLS